MQPIVDGLEDQYQGQVDFVSLNALDGEQGEAAFDAYGLRGHPSTMLVKSDGQISSVHVGIVEQEDLEQAVQVALAP